MKIKIKLTFILIWNTLMGFVSPFWTGIIYLDFTGNSKGYGYDLGMETDLYMMFGIIGLIFWVVFFLPMMIWGSIECRKFKKNLQFAPLVAFVAAFIMFVSFIGIDEYLKCFNILI